MYSTLYITTCQKQVALCSLTELVEVHARSKRSGRSRLFRRNRQAYRERAPYPPNLAFDLHISTMQGNNLLDDTQAQPRASDAQLTDTATAIEPLEQLRHIFWIDSSTRVGDLQTDVTICLKRTDLHFAFGSVADGIGR